MIGRFVAKYKDKGSDRELKFRYRTEIDRTTFWYLLQDQNQRDETLRLFQSGKPVVLRSLDPPQLDPDGQWELEVYKT